MNKWEIRYFVYHKNNRSWKCECQKLIAHSISKCHQLDTLNCSMIDLVLGFFFIFGLKTSISFIRLQLRLALHRIFLFIFSVLFISIIFFCFILFVLKLHWIFFVIYMIEINRSFNPIDVPLIRSSIISIAQMSIVQFNLAIYFHMRCCWK